jgi:hypothetical protein
MTPMRGMMSSFDTADPEPVTPEPLRKGLALVIVAFMLASAGVAACGLALRDQREQTFSQMFPYADVNHSIVLRSVEGITETDLDRIITLQLENLSIQMVEFPVGYGVRGFTYHQDAREWSEISNGMRFSPERGALLGPQGGEIPGVDVALVSYFPSGASLPDSLEIRIVVVGHFYDESEGLGEAVMAYCDLTLKR